MSVNDTMVRCIDCERFKYESGTYEYPNEGCGNYCDAPIGVETALGDATGDDITYRMAVARRKCPAFEPLNCIVCGKPMPNVYDQEQPEVCSKECGEKEAEMMREWYESRT